MGLLAILTGKTTARDVPARKKETTPLYRGVQIVTNVEGCCQAAEAIAGHRYLSHQIPRLPLDGCDASKCHCSYNLFDDRRTDLRRASDIGYDMASELRTAENRRDKSSCRRNDDD